MESIVVLILVLFLLLGILGIIIGIFKKHYKKILGTIFFVIPMVLCFPSLLIAAFKAHIALGAGLSAPVRRV